MEKIIFILLSIFLSSCSFTSLNFDNLSRIPAQSSGFSCQKILNQLIKKEINDNFRIELNSNNDFKELLSKKTYSGMKESLRALVRNYPDNIHIHNLYQVILKIDEGDSHLIPIGKSNISIKPSVSLKDNTKYKKYNGLEITIKKQNNHKIELFIDNSYNKNEQKVLVNKLKAHLAFLPTKNIELLNTIRLHSKKNSISEGGIYDTVADANSIRASFFNLFNKKGVINIYSDQDNINFIKFPQTKTDLFHEYGHILIKRMTGLFSVRRYQLAAKIDGNSISDYGDSNIVEDLADAFMLYIETGAGASNWTSVQKNLDVLFSRDIKITGLNAKEIRIKYYERFKFFDEMFDDNKKIKKEFRDYIDSINRGHLGASIIGVLGYLIWEEEK